MATIPAIPLAEFWRAEAESTASGAGPEYSDQFPSQERMSVPMQKKDERAQFDEVFAPHLPEAYRLAHWFTGNAADAEDIVQEAALKAFRSIKTFASINARAWSLTIVRNTAFSWLAKNNPRSVVYLNELGTTEQENLEYEGLYGTRMPTPEEITFQRLDAEEVQRALMKLPAQFREVIVLRELSQMNYREIAEIIDVPIGTVMSRLSRGRQLLMGLLGDRNER